MERVFVRGVTKRFDSVVAVDDVTLACEEGEFLVLLGPSGSGKTTLLRLIAGLEEVTAGEIVIAGRNVTQVPPMDRDIAMVFQNYALYPHMTVRKNLQLALRQRKVPRDVIEARTAEVVSLLQIDGLARAPAAAAVGRSTAAGRGRTRDHARAEGVPDGRAAQQSRCPAAHGHETRVDHPAAPAFGDVHLRHA